MQFKEQLVQGPQTSSSQKLPGEGKGREEIKREKTAGKE